jgi:hypothetical protein
MAGSGMVVHCTADAATVGIWAVVVLEAVQGLAAEKQIQ